MIEGQLLELFSPAWFAALGSIIIIDLVLAGDNAVVIALAARHLAPDLQRRAIFWGIFGAIATRILFVFIVIELLRFEGLSFIGGLLLIWVAVQLVTQSHPHESDATPQESFWRAVTMIVVADGIMSLDNVLAIAGASHGDYYLVVFGLALSIPIIIWGSKFFLRLLDDMPWILYVGSFVLFLTAGGMMRRDVFFSQQIASVTWIFDVTLALVCASLLIVHKRGYSRFLNK